MRISLLDNTQKKFLPARSFICVLFFFYFSKTSSRSRCSRMISISSAVAGARGSRGGPTSSPQRFIAAFQRGIGLMRPLLPNALKSGSSAGCDLFISTCQDQILYKQYNDKVLILPSTHYSNSKSLPVYHPAFAS